MTSKLDLKAGPELDGLVACLVMGAKKERGIYTYWSPAPRWEIYRPELHRAHLGWGEDNLATVYLIGIEIFVSPPSYSSEIGSAFQVVDRMRQDGFSFKAWQSSLVEPDGLLMDGAEVSFICSRGPCQKHGNPRDNHHGAYDIEAETLPLAISRAALIALRKAVE